ncbi:MAG TPA: regulatory iron-sulfur-containing complex subunit RicT [Spirochaetia bacterium]|nr:regulatory iron-sulfur-containing complex subunit RicT [Spirochaetia bacterium]
MDGESVSMSGTDALSDNSPSTGCPLAKGGSTTYLARFLHSSEVVACSFDAEPLSKGGIVVAPSRYGKDLARVLGPIRESSRELGKVIPVERIATEEDMAEFRRNQDFEEKALRTCREKADAVALKMKILAAHLLPDENKLLVFFTADGRVDFRELVRDLVSSFRMRIELRQIGVRDETRLLGGVGICGRALCCNSFPDQMCSVSIKMAKEQNLSLGSMKVSGPCGRLMCCLSYEYGYYVSERSKYPKHGTIVTGPTTSYMVSDVNMISRSILLVGQEGGVVSVGLNSLRLDPGSRSWVVDVDPESNEESPAAKNPSAE